MTIEQQADIKARTVAVAGLAATLQAELLMIGVYEEMNCDSEAEGARQAAYAAIKLIEDHLSMLKGYCNA